ncbi:MAG: 3-deoxy-8-phosphooctulonate synthase [Deltaproteobacteria bacterium]|nr:3-deoxy-8-phosphooctulonate synthase [Deltaproteobacteria bacterium]MBW2595667.1 3-deoxy-8-phosphooctulonate synthase [Deltaproteobacteria bacterium]MBW2650417.1 3-deoxy-8-phosphooctulonate synthase [Deltaproteobacteria bacterium]
MRQIILGDIVIGGDAPFVLISGPCVIEDGVKTEKIALYLKNLTRDLGIPFIFKASYDKANRSSMNSFRGPGLKEGLDILRGIKEGLGVPVLSDVHRFEEIEDASKILDIMQIPAFLCRQTDFVMEVARVAGIINVKKGQFIAPWDVSNILDKIVSSGNKNIMITERGVSFGYNNLVADMRSLPILRGMGYPVIFDATHSVQLPGGAGDSSGGNREMAVYLSRAAVATGIDGLFLEVHPDPECALCDGPNSLCLDLLPDFLGTLKEIDRIVKTGKS